MAMTLSTPPREVREGEIGGDGGPYSIEGGNWMIIRAGGHGTRSPEAIGNFVPCRSVDPERKLDLPRGGMRVTRLRRAGIAGE
jgi:hypothetical protein